MTKLFCIHGNFQTPSVWKLLEENLKVRNVNLDVIPVNLENYSFDGFDRWVDDFCNSVEIQSCHEKSFLLGYSLGGRLALHACLSRPDLWETAVVVGADPGLESEEEKKLQLDKDRNWAERLKREPLEKLVDEWDAQPVFCGIENQAPRNLGEMDPDKLSQHLETFSKGNQQNLAPKLAELTRPPILFLSGVKDKKYQKIGEELARSCPLVESRIIHDAGHRVPWENPNQFVQTLGKFINNLNIC